MHDLVVDNTVYTRQEQPFRFGLWFCGNGAASTLGGLLAYGIGYIQGNLSPWRYLFVVFGAITGVWGLVMLGIVPDSPCTARWLSQSQRKVAVQRVETHDRRATKTRFRMYQAIEAFRDPSIWFLALYVFCVNIANGGLTAFGSLVIQGFGYKGLQALLIQMPTGGAQFVFIIVSTSLCSLLPNVRVVVMMCLTIISMIGIVLMYALDPTNQAGLLAGFCLSLAFAANMPLGLSLVASNVGGFTKKAVANACVLVAYCIGNITGPQFFKLEEAPNYHRGIKACLAGFCLGVFWLVCLLAYLVWQNKSRKSELHDSNESPTHLVPADDKTDWEVQGYRYTL